MLPCGRKRTWVTAACDTASPAVGVAVQFVPLSVEKSTLSLELLGYT